VAAQAVNEQNEPVASCFRAIKREIEVVDGLTTEVLLVLQCDGGDPTGGLDIIGVLNHAPAITDIVFEPSKFLLRCEEGQVCVTAKDSDGDPLEFLWTVEPQPPDGLNTMEPTVNEDGSVTQCAKAVFDTEGSYAFSVIVFDLVHSPEGLITAEAWYNTQTTDPPLQSRDSLAFPMHVGSDLFPDTEECRIPENDGGPSPAPDAGPGDGGTDAGSGAGSGSGDECSTDCPLCSSCLHMPICHYRHDDGCYKTKWVGFLERIFHLCRHPLDLDGICPADLPACTP
jgi:hypothetical protein